MNKKHLTGKTILVPANPGSPGQDPEGHKTVAVVVVVSRQNMNVKKNEYHTGPLRSQM